MIDFFELSVRAAQEADRHIAEIGGLPEITEAAESLRAAIDQTRVEIDTAELAPRYLRTVTDNFHVMVGTERLTPAAQDLVSREGEAGYKKATLGTQLNRVESDLNRLIGELVGLRANLKISQQEF